MVDTLATTTTTTTTTTYLYDGDDIVLQLVADGATVSTRQYLHGPGIDEPLAQVQDGQSYYYHADGLGSILALTDSGKNIVQRYTYDTFGMLTSVLDSEFGNAYAYTAREWDRELGLYYYRARYYDPMEGRFISKDIVGFTAGDVNLYGYVGNQPVNFVDPSGLFNVDAGGGFGVSIPGYHVSTGLYSETCCDDDGYKHKRTVQVTCWGMSLGLKISTGGGAGRGSVSLSRETKKCVGKKGDTYEYETGFGFSAAVVGGAAWSSSDPTTTTLLGGLGISIDFFSQCKSTLIQDVKTDECCE